MEQPITSPILARRRLAAAVEDMRDGLQISQAELARRLACSPGTVGMIESRKRIPSEDFLTKLAAAAGRGDELEELIDVRRIARRREPEWRSIDDHHFQLGFDEFVSLEQSADRIDLYETRMVPGLLQTSDYAWSALTSGSATAASSSGAVRRYTIRMRRQELLSRETNPVRLWIVLDEQAMTRPIVEPGIMRDQLDHLLALLDRYGDRLHLQVYPESAAPSASSFTMLRFASPYEPGVVAVEGLTQTEFYQRPAELNRYIHEMDHLRSVALPADRSAELIKSKREEITP